jgi:hypothetical protein
MTAPPPTGALARLRTPAGRRLLLLALVAGVGLVAWLHLGRRPADAEVVVRWDGAPPSRVDITWLDDAGERLRWRRFSPSPDAGRVRDRFRLPPGRYRILVEFPDPDPTRAPDRVRTIERTIDHPAPGPLHLFLEDAR